MTDQQRSKRIAELMDEIRHARANVRSLAADADLKGPEWDGYGMEKSGQTAALARLRKLQDELESLIDRTAGERKL